MSGFLRLLGCVAPGALPTRIHADFGEHFGECRG